MAIRKWQPKRNRNNSRRGRASRRRAKFTRQLGMALECLEDRTLLATIDLANLGSAGITIYGADAGDYSGGSVSSAGDVNGDGFDDFLIAANKADGIGNGENWAGETYLVFGSAHPSGPIDLGTLGAAGITIYGAEAGDRNGISVSSTGDVNGDGFDDVFVTANRADGASNGKTRAGDSYLIFGSASLPDTIDVSSLGAAGITIYGADVGDESGISASNAGDVNGDGMDDLLIGAHRADGEGNAQQDAGESYVIFGSTSLSSSIDLSNLGAAGITIHGADALDWTGIWVSSAGDANGDGFDDLLIGAFQGDAAGNAKHDAGDSYLIFGSVSLSGPIDLANLGTAGIAIYGTDPGDDAGVSVSFAGDVNGDGFDDLLIGALLADGRDNGANDAGESYVVFGNASLSAPIDLANLGAAGITLYGIDAGDRCGHSVSTAGDVNGDGFDDLLVGASRADGADNAATEAGETHLIFGSASLPGTIDLSSLGAAGITIHGAETGDFSGASVSSLGDVNGDGFDDLMISSPHADAAGNSKSEAGESYAIFGGDFTSSVTHLGTGTDDTLTGDALANVMIGGRGADTLVGNGGADVLRSGEGDDVLAVGDLNFSRLVGGNGVDTLRLDTSGTTLDLNTLPDNRILGVEQIDITGSGPNTLTLDVREVLNMSDESNTLIIRRDADDTVDDGGGWNQQADETIGGDMFEVLTQGNATLKVQRIGLYELSGVIKYDGTPMSDLTIVQPTFWGRNESTGQAIDGIISTYDNTTGVYTLANLPSDAIGISVRFHVVGSRATLPGNYDAWQVVGINQLTPAQRGTYDISTQQIIHLSSPWDNNGIDFSTFDPYPSHRSPVEFQWDSVPGASEYRIAIWRCRDASHPDGWGIIDIPVHESIQGNTYLATLDTSSNLQHYQFSVSAYSPTQTYLGNYLTTYTNGIGWDYGFKIERDFDFGDAPSPYPTLSANNGARHAVGGPFMGTAPDVETDGQPDPNALGDDSVGEADEDGVAFGSPIIVGQLDASVTVNVQNAPNGAKLDAWIDFNADGSWDAVGERIFTGIDVTAGENVLEFHVPADAASTTTVARFRLSTAGGLALRGAAPDGEVEDHPVTIVQPLGSGQFHDSGQRLGNSGSFDVALGDVDGDGDLDAVDASPGSPGSRVWRNDGGGTFTDSGQSLGNQFSPGVSLGDVDGDGDLDAFMANGWMIPSQVWLNDGSGTFTDSGQELGSRNPFERGVSRSTQHF